MNRKAPKQIVIVNGPQEQGGDEVLLRAIALAIIILAPFVGCALIAAVLF